jgi:hypothetical protein
MAIIQCPQCKWGMSDKARICRNCGFFRSVRQSSGLGAPRPSAVTAGPDAGGATREWTSPGQNSRDTIELSLWLLFMTIVAAGICWFTG